MNGGEREREDEEEGDDGEEREKPGHAIGDPSWYQVAVTERGDGEKPYFEKGFEFFAVIHFSAASFLMDESRVY